jgi:hypothetical protein
MAHVAAIGRQITICVTERAVLVLAHMILREWMGRILKSRVGIVAQHTELVSPTLVIIWKR